MPVLYILPANQVKNKKPIMSITIDNNNSHIGTPNGKRTIMTIGDVNGKMEKNCAMLLSGSLIMFCAMIKLKMSGIVTGKINCWVSASLSTAEPIAANKAAYNK